MIYQGGLCKQIHVSLDRCSLSYSINLLCLLCGMMGKIRILTGQPLDFTNTVLYTASVVVRKGAAALTYSQNSLKRGIFLLLTCLHSVIKLEKSISYHV